MIEDVEDDVDELSDSDFSKAATIVFDKIDHWKYDVFPLSNLFDFIEKLVRVFIVSRWWFIFGK